MMITAWKGVDIPGSVPLGPTRSQAGTVRGMRTPMTIGGHLDRAALVYGDRIGIHDEPDAPGGGLGDVTYRRMQELARAQAAGLDERGIGRGERVAVLSQNSGRLLTSFFGVSGYGRVLVPINFRLSPAEIEYILEHSGASMLLVDPELAEAVAHLPVKHRVVMGTDTDGEIFLEGREPEPWDEQDEDATATINYTSGTTARPKGVEMTHRNLWSNSAIFGWHTGVSDRDTYLHTLPMFHCNGWGMPYALTAMGVPQVVLRKVDGADILRRIDQHGVTLLCGAPAVVAMVLDAAATWDGEIPGHGRTRIVVAGAPPPTRTIERIETELGWEMIQIYGLTETAPLLTINRTRSEWDALSPGERAAVLSRAGVPAVGIDLKVDGQGEVLARGNHILKSYWDQPEATADALEGGWFHTGDGGTLDDGRLPHHQRPQEGRDHLRRRERQLHRGGGRAVLPHRRRRGVRDRRARREVGRDHQGARRAGPGHERHRGRAARLVQGAPGRLQVPHVVEFRDELARTATGKLQKFKLRAPYWEGRERQVN